VPIPTPQDRLREAERSARRWLDEQIAAGRVDPDWPLVITLRRYLRHVRRKLDRGDSLTFEQGKAIINKLDWATTELRQFGR
jgi:hypothetical protein